jgi:hypothetical protein
VYPSKTNDAPPPDPHCALLPLLPPLCRPHENLVTLWNLHREERLQFLIVGHALLLRHLPDPLHRCHQIADQCARVHARTLKLDSYHGTRSGFRRPPSGSRKTVTAKPADLCPLGLQT